MGDHIRASHKAQNLARIRDNQRRSRARRKEYLQELEAKLRNCDQVGIEASSEIQTAARKVLDENKKLRLLLFQRGVSDADIVAALGGSGKSCEYTSSASALGKILERRITSSTTRSTDPLLSQQSRATSAPQYLVSAPLLSVPVSRPAVPSNCESLSPTSVASSMESPLLASYRTSLYTGSTTTVAPDIKTEETSYEYPYESFQSPPWLCSQAYTYGSNHVTYHDVSTCTDAANVARTICSHADPISHSDSGYSRPSTSMIYPFTTIHPQQYSGI